MRTRSLVIIVPVAALMFAMFCAGLIAILISAGGLAPAAPASAAPAPRNPASPADQVVTVSQTTQGISVTGEGVVLVQPDIVKLTLGVDILDPSLSAAQAEAARRMDAVVNRLKELGVEEKDIRTVMLNIQPENEYDRDGKLVRRQFRVSNLVEVTLRDVSKAGSAIDAVLDAGATRVDGIHFDIADIDPVKQRARELAMANAQAKAQQLASLAGATLGKPTFIEEADIQVTPVPYPAARLAADAQAPTTPIMGGQNEVRTSVRVVYAILST